jgi:hypothetical protein
MVREKGVKLEKREDKRLVCYGKNLRAILMVIFEGLFEKFVNYFVD